MGSRVAEGTGLRALVESCIESDEREDCPQEPPGTPG